MLNTITRKFVETKQKYPHIIRNTFIIWGNDFLKNSRDRPTKQKLSIS